MAITKEELLAEINKFVSSNNGEIPGEHRFAAATRIKQSAWRGRYWARWTDAIREAGYEPNSMQQKISDDEILSHLATHIDALNRFPTSHEINLHARNTAGFPTWTTIQRRYGGMTQTAAALLEFGRSTGDVTLQNLCQARLARETPTAAPASNGERKKPIKFGYVYLKYSPSLRLYKIGKANNPAKRGAGISLLLPEDLIPKHEIRTDYPYVLEKYWEHRFRDKKKQGEWYDLNSAEVAAFKKRREFMFGEFFP